MCQNLPNATLHVERGKRSRNATLRISIVFFHFKPGYGLVLSNTSAAYRSYEPTRIKMMIRGIYKLPAIKHTFLIWSSPDEDQTDEMKSIENRRRREYFEHILESKDRMLPKEVLLWRLKVVSEDDFLLVIRQRTPIDLISSSQSSENPEMLELLAINLLRNPVHLPSDTCETTKFLCTVPDEDIIEVFI